VYISDGQNSNDLFLEKSGESLKSYLVEFQDDVHQTVDADNCFSDVAHLASSHHAHKHTYTLLLISSTLLHTQLIVTEVRSESFGLVTERHHDIGVLCAASHVNLLDAPGLCNARHIFYRRVWYRALSLRYACMRRSASSSSPGLPLCQISFLSRPPLPS